MLRRVMSGSLKLSRIYKFIRVISSCEWALILHCTICVAVSDVECAGGLYLEWNDLYVLILIVSKHVVD